MPEIFSTSGEKSENVVVPTPRLQGLFVPGIDNPLAVDGFGIVTPWGGGGTARKYTDYGISDDISRQSTQLGDLASSLIPAEGAGISYNWEGLVGSQGPRGPAGPFGIIAITSLPSGYALPTNSNFLTALPHNIDQINALGTAVDKLIYTNAYNTYTENVWTERQPAGDTDKNWRGVASDDDGSNLIAADYGGRLWTSDDSGVTWTERRPAGDTDKDWLCVASDSDGSHLIAGIYGGRLYTSADSGVNWTERKPAGESNENWRGVASDSDGSNLIAVTFGDDYYLSNDYGANWTTKSSGFWQSTSSDSDGSHLILSSSTRFYTSANSGANWTERQPAGAVTKDWECIASDDDGSNLLAGVKDGRLYTSANLGVDWTERQPGGVADKNWFCGASDSDGSNLIVGESSGRLYTSDDSGATWTEEQPAGVSNENWTSVASDSDGSNLIAASYVGRLYTKAAVTLYSEATWAESDLTSAGRAILDDANAAAQAVTLGLEIGVDVQAWDTQLDNIAALAVTDGNLLVGNGSNWIVESGNTARTSFGLGTGDTPTFNQVLLGIDPTNISHSVTKSYADALVAGAFWIDVDVATTANVDLSNALEAGDTIDDYVLVENDRVLVKEQTDQTQNGLYTVPASGAASRSTDADTVAEIENKKCIPLNGATTKHRLYFCITGDITLGVTDIKFAEVTQVSTHNTLSGIQGGQANEYYHLTSAEHIELNAWLDDVTLSNGGTMNLGTGALTAANYTAAALLTACASNAGEIDFTGASKKLDVENNAVVSQDYSSDASPQFLGIEVGHANDTTITRASAGVIAVQGTNVMLVGDAPAAHTIASHSDTTGTGANLNTLVGGGDVGALHTHAAAYQPLDTGLTNLAALGYVSDSMIKVTAGDTYAIRTMAEVRTDLGLVIGTNVLAEQTIGIVDDNLIEIDDADAVATDYCRLTANGIQGRDATEVKTDLGLVIGTNVLAEQAIGIADDNLLEVDDADAANTDYARFTANGLQGRDATEVKTDLGLVIGTNVQAYDAELTSLAALSYVAASFVKMTGANTFALRTIGETADDLEATIDHDNLANGGAHDYAYISGNDGATGITAAELEELSDGSETTLHTHDYAAAFGRPVVLTPQNSCGPAANFATHDTIAGGSTPVEVVSVLDFDPDASEYSDFKFALPSGYAGGGLTVTIIFSMTSDHDEGTPHKVRWEIGFARIDDDGIAISADHAYDFNGVSATVPSVLTEVSYDSITFTNGADMDSLAAGEMAILRIYRDHDHADDNATGDAELQMIMIKET